MKYIVLDTSDRKNIQNNGSMENRYRDGHNQRPTASSVALLDGPCQMLPNCLESPSLRAGKVAAS